MWFMFYVMFDVLFFFYSYFLFLFLFRRGEGIDR